MTQNTEQNVRTRDDQVDDLFLELSKGSVILGRASVAEAHIAEAEARGAAEERGKAAEGQEPVAFQILHHATWREAIPANEAYWTSRGYKVRRLYTHPANVAALERDLNSWRDRFWKADKERTEYRECMTDCLNLLSRTKTGGLSRIWLKDTLGKHPQHPEEDQ